MNYVKELQNMLPYTLNIEQIGAKQMAIVTHSDLTIALYSYRTRVGRQRGDTWYLTTKKYSPTTTRQLRHFAHTVRRVNIELVDDFDNIRN